MEKGYAVPGFYVWNAESMRQVLEAAARLKAPIILMSGPGETASLPMPVMAEVARAAGKCYDIPSALQLDHGRSFEHVEECLASGYTSVMLDYSSKPFAENVEALKRVVAMAHPMNVSVEGEIGAVGRADLITKEGGHASNLTDPDEALAYAQATGVDALAVSIGNAHGQYAKLPRFDFDRLEKIHAKVDLPLVLHGGSGTPDDDLKRAISLGIAKVNIATDLALAVKGSLQEQWKKGLNPWFPTSSGEAYKTMAPVVEKWIRRVGAEGRG